MLGCNLPEADVATRYFLKVCRYTAAGQYMDIRLPHQPLAELSIYNALRVAYLKTALYGFTAPLVCGAMLSGSAPEIINKLERFGRYVGTAYQLRDDLLGLYGQSSVVGKPTDSDRRRASVPSRCWPPTCAPRPRPARRWRRSASPAPRTRRCCSAPASWWSSTAGVPPPSASSSAPPTPPRASCRPCPRPAVSSRCCEICCRC
ncbi:polyprenyl synthetase family protein [Cystobacter fuscus]